MAKPGKKVERRRMKGAVLVRCDEKQLGEWKLAAERDGRTVSNWLRMRATEAARRELGEKGKG